MNQRETLTRNQTKWLAVATGFLLLPLMAAVSLAALVAPRPQLAPQRDVTKIEERFADSIRYVRPTAEPTGALIAAGHKGAFTPAGTSCTEPDGPRWAVYRSPYNPRSFNAVTGPRGFVVRADGTVSVPRDALPGVYSGMVLSGGAACGPSTDGVTNFSFEVAARK